MLGSATTVVRSALTGFGSLLGDLQLLPPLAGPLEQLVARAAPDAAQPLYPRRRDLGQLANGGHVELLLRGRQSAGR